jgi:3-oxoacyl-[acyl-carrier-protein] synthase III
VPRLILKGTADQPICPLGKGRQAQGTTCIFALADYLHLGPTYTLTHFARIAGVGHHVPSRAVTNADLAQLMDTSDAWITERTGIKERHWYTPGVDTTVSMGTEAARNALAHAGLQPADVDFIVFCTITPDSYFPGGGVYVGAALGLPGVPALDVRNQCSAFIYGLSVADQFIRSGMYSTVLVVGSEIQSSLLDLSDKGRNVSVIFGDGAGAAVLQRSSKPGIRSTHLHADGRFADELTVKEPSASGGKRRWLEKVDDADTWCHMNGSTVFKHALVHFPAAVREALASNNCTVSDLDLLVPHQANQRITDAVGQELGLPPEKVVSNIARYGNTTGASIPIALSEAWAEGRVQPGMLVCLAAFGSGFTWGSALIDIL